MKLGQDGRCGPVGPLSCAAQIQEEPRQDDCREAVEVGVQCYFAAVAFRIVAVSYLAVKTEMSGRL